MHKGVCYEIDHMRKNHITAVSHINLMLIYKRLILIFNELRRVVGLMGDPYDAKEDVFSL